MSTSCDHWFYFICTAAALGACGSSDSSSGAEASRSSRDALRTYTELARRSYADSLGAARTIESSCADLIAAPSEVSLEAARQAWRDAREPYLQTEVFRFYDGPIDNPESGPEGMINAWPLDEAYIDYVEGDASSGIINDPSLELDVTGLMELNEQGGEKNIATGYHAIEFLLWGQDASDSGPGDRPYTDYVTDGSGTASNQERRAEYLSTVAGLLVEHLSSVVEAWEDGEPSNYCGRFLAAPSKDSLSRVLTGMVVLTGFETGGERLQTALDSGDQEDEHSCFSDNTHRDMVQDVRGIQNVWLGRYADMEGRLYSGVGVRDVVRELDPELAAALDERVSASLGLAEELEPPFDREISVNNTEGRERVRSLVVSLNEQEGLLQDVFRVLELEIPETP